MLAAGSLRSGCDDERPKPVAPERRAVVLGVVLAGVLVSFAAPGPYSYASTLIGLVLTCVLVGFGGRLPDRSYTDAVGYAAAVAFVAVLVVGQPLDAITSNWFSGWKGGSVSDVHPEQADGRWPFVVWAGLFSGALLLLALRVHNQRKRGSPPTEPQTHPAETQAPPPRGEAVTAATVVSEAERAQTPVKVKPRVAVFLGADGPVTAQPPDGMEPGIDWWRDVTDAANRDGVVLIGVELPAAQTPAYDWAALQPLVEALDIAWPTVIDWLDDPLPIAWVTDSPGFNWRTWFSGLALSVGWATGKTEEDIRYRLELTTLATTAIDHVLFAVMPPRVSFQGVATGEPSTSHPPLGSDWQHLMLGLQEAHDLGAKLEKPSQVAVHLLLKLSRGFEAALNGLQQRFDSAERGAYAVLSTPELERAAFDSVPRLQWDLLEIAALAGRIGPRLESFVDRTDTAAKAPEWFNLPEDRAFQLLRSRYEDAGKTVTALRQDLRAAATLVGTLLELQHVRMTWNEQQRDTRFQRGVALFGGLVLLPTLVATIFSQDVLLPWRHRWQSLVLLAGLIVLAGAGGAIFLLRQLGKRK